MEKVIYDIVVDSKDAINNIKDINKELKDTKDLASDTSKETEEVGKSAGKSKKGFKMMGKGIKAVGTALKAAGIGLIVGIIAGLTDAFSRNKKIMDAVGLVMGTIQQVFSQVTDALVSTYEAVSSSSENFDALGKVMGGIITLAITPFQLAFYGIQKAVQQAQLAWEGSFFGGGDEDKMARLQLDILETDKNIRGVMDAASEAGSDISNNIGEAISEVGAIATTAGENLSKVSIGAAKKQAEANQKAEQAAVLAEAQAGRLVAQYERQAEQQRQLRDDTSASIADRKKANEELGKVLEEQEKQLLKQADAVIAGAQAELQKNNSIENQAALIAAVAAKEQVLSDIEGKRSEQKVNAVALDKEAIDMALSKGEAEATLSLERKKFNAEQITDEELKIKALKQILEEEKKTEIDRLTAKRDSFKEGTQAYVDAQIELNARKEEFRQQDITLEQQEKDRKATELQENIDSDLLTFEARREALKTQRQAILDDETLSEKERTKMLQANSIKNQEIDQKEADAKKATLAAVGTAMSAFSDLAGKDTAEGKALAIAAATISTYQGIAGIWGAKPEGTATTTLVAKIAASAAVAASGFAAVKGIISTKVPNSSGAGGGGATPSIPNSPNFNVVGQSQGNVNSQTEAAAQQSEATSDRPTRAYVVSTDITSQQALDRDIESQGELG